MYDRGSKSSGQPTQTKVVCITLMKICGNHTDIWQPYGLPSGFPYGNGSDFTLMGLPRYYPHGVCRQGARMGRPRGAQVALMWAKQRCTFKMFCTWGENSIAKWFPYGPSINYVTDLWGRGLGLHYALSPGRREEGLFAGHVVAFHPGKSFHWTSQLFEMPVPKFSSATFCESFVAKTKRAALRPLSRYRWVDGCRGRCWSTICFNFNR